MRELHILLISISVPTNHLGITVGYPMYVLLLMDITFVYYMYIEVPVISTYGGIAHNQLTLNSLLIQGFNS